MTHQSTHAATVARALAQYQAGQVITAQFGAYIAGADAVDQGIETCPFDRDELPDLADQWERGRTDTLDFRTRRKQPRGGIDRLSARARRPAATHAAHTHPRDD